MQARIHGGRPRHPAGIPWLFVATIIGIVVVLGAAVLYFSGTGSQAPATHSSSDMIPAHVTTGTTPATSGSSAGATPTSTFVVVPTTAAAVPASGVSISVSYIGGFNGTYTTGGVTIPVTGSGSQVYTVSGASGMISATFQKMDNTATHALTVTIYENGNQLATQSTSAGYGKVTVTANV